MLLWRLSTPKPVRYAARALKRATMAWHVRNAGRRPTSLLTTTPYAGSVVYLLGPQLPGISARIFAAAVVMTSLSARHVRADSMKEP